MNTQDTTPRALSPEERARLEEYAAERARPDTDVGIFARAILALQSEVRAVYDYAKSETATRQTLGEIVLALVPKVSVLERRYEAEIARGATAAPGEPEPMTDEQLARIDAETLKVREELRPLTDPLKRGRPTGADYGIRVGSSAAPVGAEDEPRTFLGAAGARFGPAGADSTIRTARARSR